MVSIAVIRIARPPLIGVIIAQQAVCESVRAKVA
jgi:hypothetical protein